MVAPHEAVTPADLDVLRDARRRSGFRWVSRNGVGWRAGRPGVGRRGKYLGYARTPAGAAALVVRWLRRQHGDGWATRVARPPRRGPLTPDQVTALVAPHGATMQKLATDFARRWGLTGDDYDDLLATVYLGFVQAAADFDPGRGVKFLSYAAPIARWSAVAYIRGVYGHGFGGTHWRGGRPRVVSADRPLGGDDSATVGETTPDHREPDGGWHDLTAGLPDRDRELLALRFRDDLTYREIGARVGMGYKAVSARLTELLGTLCRRLAPEYAA